MKGDLNFWVPDGGDRLPLNAKRKRNTRSKILEYNGWASTVLIHFLESIGIDTSKKLSETDVANIVQEYVNNNKLFIPGKRKRVLCDEKLIALFGKKSIPRVKIQNLLEPHFSENKDSSEDDEFGHDSDEDEFESVKTGNKAFKSEQRNKTSKKPTVLEPPKSCFAAVIPANVKSVYLKRSLFQEFAKVPETFRDKVVGCFVRLKSDPNDYLQKNSHHLQQVIGIISKGEKIDAEVQLRLSNYFKDVSLHQLSDDNFTEEECVDLHERVKAGELKRPTVVELEAKAKILHEDITKHWISKEISLLQKLIDRANEKGWRREMYSYLERKELLEKATERNRLLSEIPKVIADALEIESTETAPKDIDECNLQENDTNHFVCNNGNDLKGLSLYPSFNQRHLIINLKENEDNANRATTYLNDVHVLQPTDHVQEGPHPDFVTGEESYTETPAVHIVTGVETNTETPALHIVTGVETNTETPALHTVTGVETNTETPVLHIFTGVETNTETQVVHTNTKIECSPLATPEVIPTLVIELSDDDDDDEEVEGMRIQNPTVFIHPHDMIWCYLDPQGQAQGPFTLASLKQWYDEYYLPEGFRVWKLGQNPFNSLLLSDVLRHTFPF